MAFLWQSSQQGKVCRLSSSKDWRSWTSPLRTAEDNPMIMLLAWKERIKVFRLGCFSWTQEPFFVPCGAHTLNLVVACAAKSSPDAIGYFGYLAKLFKLFSASPHRWDILLKYAKTTLKTWSGTRWESRIDSIHAVRYKAGQVREALEVRETTTDPVVKVEAQSLAEEIGFYRFSICTVIWYDILCQIQHVSKLMQSPSIQIDVDLLLTCWKQRFRWQLQNYCVYKCTDNCKGNVWRDERGSSTQTKVVENHKKAVWLWGSKWACWWCKSKIWKKKSFM